MWIYLSLSRLWYAVPPTKGGTTDGQYTVHRCAGAPLRIPGFDQLDARGVSTVSPTLRDGVPSASRRVAPRWEAAHRQPVHSLQELSLANAGRSTVLHSVLPQDLCAPGGARAPVRHGSEQSESMEPRPLACAAGGPPCPWRCPGPLPDGPGPAARGLGGRRGPCCRRAGGGPC